MDDRLASGRQLAVQCQLGSSVGQSAAVQRQPFGRGGPLGAQAHRPVAERRAERNREGAGQAAHGQVRRLQVRAGDGKVEFRLRRRAAGGQLQLGRPGERRSGQCGELREVGQGHDHSTLDRIGSEVGAAVAR